MTLCRRCNQKEVGSDQEHVTFPLCDDCRLSSPIKYHNRDRMLNVPFISLKGKEGFVQQRFSGKLAVNEG